MDYRIRYRNIESLQHTTLTLRPDPTLGEQSAIEAAWGRGMRAVVARTGWHACDVTVEAVTPTQSTQQQRLGA